MCSEEQLLRRARIFREETYRRRFSSRYVRDANKTFLLHSQTRRRAKSDFCCIDLSAIPFPESVSPKRIAGRILLSSANVASSRATEACLRFLEAAAGFARYSTFALEICAEDARVTSIPPGH